MRVDFPRWEDGDLTGWLSHAEHYFRYHRMPEASMVDIGAIHLEGDAYNSTIGLSTPKESICGDNSRVG
ncbi:hypothetical protein GW17_00030327 [Ensete ventricosum]|nr:hypothetical protein GW17_00030327 [Ensete ventricosum]